MMGIQEIGTMVLGGFCALLAGTIYSAFTRGIKKRVSFHDPGSASLEKMIPTVNLLLVLQAPIITALIALLESAQGECDGNVDAALDVMKDKEKELMAFLTESSKVKS